MSKILKVVTVTLPLRKLFEIYKTISRINLIARLRLRFSHLREHEFRQNIQDT